MNTYRGSAICHRCGGLIKAPTRLGGGGWSSTRLLLLRPVSSAVKGPRASLWHRQWRAIAPSIQTATIGSTAGDSPWRLDQDLRELLTRGSGLLQPFGPVPSETDVRDLLLQCQVLAERLMASPREPSADSTDKLNAASALLDLGGSQKKQASMLRPPGQSDASNKMIEALAKFAHQVVVHPTVFISPTVLAAYVAVQTTLNRPESLPDVFELYATKPIPQLNTNPVKYNKPNPNGAKSAIPAPLAQAALESALRVKDLELALLIIDTSFATPAFRRAKTIRKATLPAVAVGLAPAAAWVVASKLSAWQLAGDGYLTPGFAFAAIMTYLSTTGTLGFVAFTTANDHMDRVTWMPGTSLIDRWTREEERAALDRVAGAWGFQNPLRRGEEEGEEWEALRDWMGRRRMILDKESDMPRME